MVKKANTFFDRTLRSFCLELSPAPFPMTSQYSDIVSSSVVAILKRDPRRVIFITEKLFGQQLPLSLRQFIWTECLLRFEKKPFDYDLVRYRLSLISYFFLFKTIKKEFCGTTNSTRFCSWCNTRKDWIETNQSIAYTRIQSHRKRCHWSMNSFVLIPKTSFSFSRHTVKFTLYIRISKNIIFVLR